MDNFRHFSRALVYSVLASSALLGLSSCVGVGLPGKIYAMEEGIVLPMEIETSYGHGAIRCDNPNTGEHFEGTYSAVGSGASGFAFNQASGSAYTNTGTSVHGSATGTSNVFVQSVKADSIATMIGDKGTVLDCNMDIQRGMRPHGIGNCVDNKGKTYRLQF